MIGVTVAGLAPCPACNVPGVGCAAVTVLANHVGQAVALAAATLAVAVTWRRAAGGLAAQTVAHALWSEEKGGVADLVRVESNWEALSPPCGCKGNYTIRFL